MFTVSSLYLFGDFDSDREDEIIKKDIKVSPKKTNYKFLTTNNDNISNLLYTPKKEIINEEIIEPEVKNGFIIENGNTYYYENNNIVVGEKEIESSIYYFDDNGILLKKVFINNNYYNEEGKKVFGFYEIDNNTYYFTDNGYLVGINEIEGNIYFFDENGILQKDIIIDNCYYDMEGKLYTGFKEIDGYTYYFNRDGIVKGLIEIDNKKYIFDEEGHLIKNSFYDNYYLNENGEVTTGNKDINGRTYIFNEEGKLQNGFQIIDNKEYFLDENLNRLTGLQLIDDIRYYFDFETGELIKKDVKSVIDISSWQGDINFDELKNSKLVDGVIVRLGYGTTLSDSPVLDNKFKKNISELKRVGIPYGVYFFGYAQNEYASSLEANFVINTLKEENVDLSFPIFYDAELTNYDGVYYSKNLYKKVINNFISVLNSNGYNDVGVYGNLYMLSKGSLNTLAKKIPKWVAQYNTICEYENEHVGWQYTSSGSIPGIEGRVDMNIFY